MTDNAKNCQVQRTCCSTKQPGVLVLGLMSVFPNLFHLEEPYETPKIPEEPTLNLSY